MQHHPPHDSAQISDIPLEKVPPLYDGRRAALGLNVIVVGAGLGGLAATYTIAHAGHRVTLLESAPVLGEVGAGIQVSPNATRLLLRWGLGPLLDGTVVEPTAIVFRRFDTGERIGYTRWGALMVERHGAPYYHIHRADYHAMLLRLAQAAPDTHIRLGATVRGVQPDPAAPGGPSVTLASGEVLHADLIVAADGVKSSLQKAVTGLEDAPTPTGDAAYRAVIPTDLMFEDPDLRPLLETPEMTSWMAPQRHLVGYCLVSIIYYVSRLFFPLACSCSVCLTTRASLQRKKKEYNLVLVHPDDGSVESWTEEGSGDKMRADFADFEPSYVTIYPAVMRFVMCHVNSRSLL